MKNIIILILLATNIWFGATIIPFQNFQSGWFVNACDDLSGYTKWSVYSNINEFECLNDFQTKTHPIWNLFQALF